MKLLLLPLILIGAALCGCATPSIESSPLPDPSVAEAIRVAPRDAIELRFLHRPLPQDTPYRLEIGDKIRVHVFDHAELSQVGVLVLPDGHVSLPLIPRLSVVGLAVEEVAAEIAARYREEQIRDPDVTVSVESSGSRLRDFLDSVNGNGGRDGIRVPVESDGSIALPALDSIVADGTVDEVRARIQAAYVEEFGPELAVAVRHLPREGRLAFVIGEVTNPGPVTLDPHTNTLIAVARAGGFLPTANIEKIRLYRFAEGDDVDQWQIDLAATLNHGEHTASQIELHERDVIFVPRTGVAVANEIVKQYIRNMLPTTVGFGVSYGINQQVQQ